MRFRLLFQGLAQLAGPRLHFVEQPSILDRNYRLVGKGGDQLDLFAGEWLYRSSRENKCSDRCSLPHQRDTKGGAHILKARSCDQLELRVSLGVCSLNSLALNYRATTYSSSIRFPGMLPHVVLLLGGETMACDMMVGAFP